MLVWGPLAKNFYLAGLLGLLTFECRIIQSLQRLDTFGICLKVVSEPLKVQMLPVLVQCLVALALVARNLRDLHQKGEMPVPCEIRLF